MAVVLVIVCILTGAGQAYAQALHGSIVGIVTDPSGAGVPGATVKITETGTNQSRQTTANETGTYDFPLLLSGVYEVNVTMGGFESYTRTGVTVTVGSVVRVDVSLKVGNVTESVQVTAQAATLQADRAEVRGEIVTKSLQELPVPVNRNYQNLLIMIPGFSPPNNSSSLAANPARGMIFSVNGTTTNSTTTRIEGANAINAWMSHETGYVPGLEAIETVSVVTGSFDAEQGLAGGAAVDVQMKSGTNQIHGSGFWYHTNNAMKAKPFFLPPGERNPKDIDHQLGGTVGGPIKKDKLFYFGSYDGQFMRQTGASYATVPTAAIAAGDMSGSANPIYDPFTGTSDGKGRIPLSNNQVPRSLMDPLSLKIQSLVPAPTWPDLLTRNYYATGPFRVNRHKFDGKVNWITTDKLNITGRLGLLRYGSMNRGVFGDNGGPVSSANSARQGDLHGSVINSTASVNYVFGPNFIVDGYFGYTRLDTAAEPIHIGENLGLDLLKIPGTNGPTRPYGGYPSFSISNYTGSGTPRPVYYTDPSYDYKADASWIKRNHNIRFGIDIAKIDNNNWEVGGGGSFSFAGGPTTLNGGKASNQYNTYASYLLGLTSGASNTFLRNDRATTRMMLYSLYLRDQWQINRKLTFSFGTRWDYSPFGRGKSRGFQIYDWATNTMYLCGLGNTPMDCGTEVPKTNFSPRAGIAYRATQTFVIRAGFGINFDPNPLSYVRDMMNTADEVVTATWPAAANSYLWLSRFEDGIPAPVWPDFSSGVIPNYPLTQSFTSAAKKYRMGYIESWNFTLQKELKWGFIGQAGYVATRQIKQLQLIDQNYGRPGGGTASRQLYPKFRRTASSNVAMNFGHNSYNSLQTTLVRSFANGVQFNATYTFSKGLGLCCDQMSDKGPAIPIPEFMRLNRALWSHDRTHVLNIAVVAEVPFGRGKPWLDGGSLGSKILGGWMTNLLLSSYTGRPISVSASGTSLNSPGSTQRADQVKPEVAILGGTGPGQSWFDPLAFAPVTEARFGTAGFYSIRGPGSVNLDFGLVREFQVKERLRLQLRAEAFNFTNTPHFANPGTNASNMVLNGDRTIKSLAGYTEITDTTGVGREGIDERQFRLSLRIRF